MAPRVYQGVALSLLAHDGRLLQVGYSDSTLGGVLLKDIVYHEIQIIGSLACSNKDLIDIVQFAEMGRVKLNVTCQYALKDINSAISDLENNKIKGRSIVVP